MLVGSGPWPPSCSSGILSKACPIAIDQDHIPASASLLGEKDENYKLRVEN